LRADDLFLSYIHPLAGLSSSGLVGWRHEILDGFLDPDGEKWSICLQAQFAQARGHSMTPTQKMHNLHTLALFNPPKMGNLVLPAS